VKCDKQILVAVLVVLTVMLIVAAALIFRPSSRPDTVASHDQSTPPQATVANVSPQSLAATATRPASSPTTPDDDRDRLEAAIDALRRKVGNSPGVSEARIVQRERELG
jgi:hypothetical protein